MQRIFLLQLLLRFQFRKSQKKLVLVAFEEVLVNSYQKQAKCQVIEVFSVQLFQISTALSFQIKLGAMEGES